MQRTWIILLSCQMALSNMVTHELVKMPFLFQHFQQHKQIAPQTSFFNYLTLHYSNAKHERSDRSHERLPGHMATPPTLLVFTTSIQLEIAYAHPLAQQEQRQTYLQREANCLKGFLSSLFRPPSC